MKLALRCFVQTQAAQGIGRQGVYTFSVHDSVQLSVPLLAVLFGVQLTVPLLAIFSGILFNRADVNRLEARLGERIDRLEAKVDSRLDSIQRDLREMYGIQRQHETRLDALERDKK